MNPPNSKPEEMLISCDDHMDLCYVPADLWQSRVASNWQDSAPRVETLESGKTMWVREGKHWGIYGSKKADGRKVPFDLAGLSEEMEPGVFRPSNAHYRLEDMEQDGVYAQVIYNFLDWSFEDPALKSVCVQAFNSWLAEFCAVDPNRLVGLAVLPSHDAAAALREFERVTRLGLRGAIFDVFDASMPISDPAWDPLWAAAAESGTAISVHIGFGSHQPMRPGSKDTGLGLGKTWRLPMTAATSCLSLARVLAEVIFSGLLERQPELKFVLGESSIGWIPFVLERLDFEHANYREHLGNLPKLRPSEQFRRNVSCTFQDEAFGVEMIPRIGEDNVMWASDYPHGDSTFPHTREAVARIFADSPPALSRKVSRDNAARLYRIEAPC
ncbi:MAG: amidohydrolase family protein [Myxococcota bacterium]